MVDWWVAQGDDSAEGFACSALPEGAQTPEANCYQMFRNVDMLENFWIL